MEILETTICQPHATALRTTIESFGLGKFIAQDQDELIQRIQEKESGNATAGYEPFFDATFSIVRKALMDGGPEAVRGCALCNIGKKHPELVDDWVEGASTDQLETAIELGLVQSGTA